MSMNLHLSAQRLATFENGEKYEVEHTFDLYQTPTKITYSILEKEDILKAYEEWVKPLDSDSKSHISKLKNWLEEHRNWEIEWFAM